MYGNIRQGPKMLIFEASKCPWLPWIRNCSTPWAVNILTVARQRPNTNPEVHILININQQAIGNK